MHTDVHHLIAAQHENLKSARPMIVTPYSCAIRVLVSLVVPRFPSQETNTAIKFSRLSNHPDQSRLGSIQLKYPQ